MPDIMRRVEERQLAPQRSVLLTKNVQVDLSGCVVDDGDETVVDQGGRRPTAVVQVAGFDLAVVLIEQVALRVVRGPLRIELDVPGLLVEPELVEPDVRHHVDSVRAHREGVLNLLERLVVNDVEQRSGLLLELMGLVDEGPVPLPRASVSYSGKFLTMFSSVSLADFLFPSWK